jgi:hypothetical protein
MIIPLKYGDAIAKAGDNIYPLLSRSQQYVLMILAENLRLNPAIFYSDYYTEDTNDINDFNNELVASIMDDDVIETQWKFAKVRIFADEMHVVSGNSLIWVSNTAQSFGGYWVQSAPALNDNRAIDTIGLRKGFYVLRVLHIKGTQQGTINFNFDFGTVLTIDMYNATTLTNQRTDSSEFEITETGLYGFWSEVTGKNASALTPFYYAYLTSFEFYWIHD